jgi:hypothetical protein
MMKLAMPRPNTEVAAKTWTIDVAVMVSRNPPIMHSVEMAAT